ncbi:MAG: glycosyltransferase family 4 protein [Chthoniobacteraceae bacterium]|nr:glycosyltransferase family 4 protein [Chthoniobacteraceae bacterium]
MILFSHPTGNANVRQAALALAGAGLLGEYWTCVGWNPGSAWNRVLPRAVRRLLGRRALPEALRERAHYYPWREAVRMAASRWPLPWLTAHETGPFCIDAVYRTLDRRVARRAAGADAAFSAVYAYEDGAAATFAAARARGMRCFYDLPIGYWRAAQAVYREEQEREPQWACTLTGTLDSPAKLARKEEELALADAVFVASSFTTRTLARAGEAFSKPVHVIPYGAPLAFPVAAGREEPARRGGPLKVLFVGGLGQRKGLSYLLEAVEMLGAGVELTLVGRKTTEDCAPLDAALRRHRWIPSLAHDAVLREMSRHDVFVFPSLFEGFGLVLLEAMAQGLPIIATEHTAAPDLLEEGGGGFLVPIRSAQAIAEKLDLLARDPGLLWAMKSAARETALRHTWERYRERLAQAVAAALPEAQS